jgi:hypothetical protein
MAIGISQWNTYGHYFVLGIIKENSMLQTNYHPHPETRATKAQSEQIGSKYGPK